MPRPTDYAIKLIRALRKLGTHVHTETNDGYKHVDISIPEAKVDIEVDGRHHLTNPNQIVNDLSREHFSKLDGYETIHVPNNQIYEDLPNTANAIAEAAAIKEERIHNKNRPQIN